MAVLAEAPQALLIGWGGAAGSSDWLGGAIASSDWLSFAPQRVYAGMCCD